MPETGFVHWFFSPKSTKIIVGILIHFSHSVPPIVAYGVSDLHFYQQLSELCEINFPC